MEIRAFSLRHRLWNKSQTEDYNEDEGKYKKQTIPRAHDTQLALSEAYTFSPTLARLLLCPCFLRARCLGFGFGDKTLPQPTKNDDLWQTR
jgi:hypothetical protein